MNKLEALHNKRAELDVKRAEYEELQIECEREGIERLRDVISNYGLSNSVIAQALNLPLSEKNQSTDFDDTANKSTKSKRPPSLFYGNETLGKITANSLSRDPWFGLLECGDIENHRVTHAQQQEDGSWLCWNSKSQTERPSWVTGKARTLSDIDWDKHFENAKNLREQNAEKVSDDN